MHGTHILFGSSTHFIHLFMLFVTAGKNFVCEQNENRELIQFLGLSIP